MKKIININLSGRVIPIEDTAYEKLQNYIEALRRYFANEEGRDEIINDIESRVAELMNDKIRKGANAITDADIDEIIASMGRPEDFEAADFADETTGSQKSSEGTASYAEPKKRNRFYRDANDKVLGGVCAGLANYLNVDPAIIRLLFAIITLGGFGFGVLVYILLWIILPERGLESYGGRRLYRNPDDKIIGGVAGGLAAYFNKDAKIIRLIFAAPLLLNILIGILSIPFFSFGAVFPSIAIGSLTGTFFLIYIVMWIVLPEANTEYQKMEMRGEKVDVNTIRQNVQDRAKEFGTEVKTAAQNFGEKVRSYSKERSKTFSREVNEAGARVGSGLGHVIGVLFKVFFFLVAGSIAFGLFVALIVVLSGGAEFWPLKNYIFNGFWQNAFAWGTVIFFLAVPLLAFITWLVRRMMRVRSQNNYLGWTFGGLWALGWVCASLLAASMVRDFRNTEKVAEEVMITQPQTGRITVNVNEPEIRYSNSWLWMDFDGSGFDVNEDSMKMANVKVRVVKSDDSLYRVFVSRYSSGRNFREAEERARKIRFNYSYANEVLNLGSGLAIDEQSKFRLQRVLVEIHVPAGKKIRFDESLDMYHPFNVRVYEKKQRGWRRSWDRDYEMEWDWDNYFNWDVNVDYVMREDGTLINPDKPSAPAGNNYRYERNNDERRKKQLQEELRQIEERQKRDSLNKPNQSKKESIEDINEETTGSSGFSSPVFSLLKFIN